MTKIILNMVFLFGALMVAYELQDNGQDMAATLLFIFSLALAFVIQVGKN